MGRRSRTRPLPRTTISPSRQCTSSRSSATTSLARSPSLARSKRTVWSRRPVADERSQARSSRLTSRAGRWRGTLESRHWRTVGTARERSVPVSPRRNRNRRNERSAVPMYCARLGTMRRTRASRKSRISPGAKGVEPCRTPIETLGDARAHERQVPRDRALGERTLPAQVLLVARQQDGHRRIVTGRHGRRNDTRRAEPIEQQEHRPAEPSVRTAPAAACAEELLLDERPGAGPPPTAPGRPQPTPCPDPPPAGSRA